jgi:hypothetical protein
MLGVTMKKVGRWVDFTFMLFVIAILMVPKLGNILNHNPRTLSSVLFTYVSQIIYYLFKALSYLHKLDILGYRI